MIVKGKTLILDNFRKVLSGYSIDIQDIVRSAILDGVDISKYIDACKNSPYRLDQIRLGIKEGLPDTFFSLSGEQLYRFRSLKADGKDVRTVSDMLRKSTLSDAHIDYVLKWVSEGRNIKGLNVALIPRKLLSVYDSGLSSGVDMSMLVGTSNYSEDYLQNLIILVKNGRDCSKFIDGSWDEGIVKVAARRSSNHLGWYEEWYSYIRKGMSPLVLDEIAGILNSGFSLIDSYKLTCSEIAKLIIKEGSGTPDLDYCSLLNKAARGGMNLRKFIGLNLYEADSLYQSTKQESKVKISGSIRGKRS